MVWTKLDDGFYLNPKLVGLSDGAFRLYVQGLNYSSDQLTDGVIRSQMLGILIPGVTPATAKKRARELEEAGLWHEHALGWEINDFTEYQPTSTELHKKREKKRLAGEKGNHERWHQDKIDPDCQFCDADAIAPATTVRPEADNGANPPEPEPEPEPESERGVVGENGKGGFQGGLPKPKDIPASEWAIACRIVNDRRAEGYPVTNPGGLARSIVEHDRDLIRAELARSRPIDPVFSGLLNGIGRSIEEAS